ncbi:P-loop containing nucleoside triphosphate hydrolase protein [Chytriomyces cf. hyalinus JEL632]|nr:P-loop containing nucleoside triphosphate hydrolase protein [Chytriomyces cf. hyalinus JEL632]
MEAIRKQLKSLQQKQSNIRNICILAHVDHGKTTLSDSLLASNGIISAKMAGKVRYLDSREDEIERGITMKSSGISLLFRTANSVPQQESPNQTNDTLGTQDFLVNLIDSPGHVDFASEVSTASRLCDGCLVLVDAVEGVCTQTHTVLRQALSESIRPILVINKIDRLITQLKMSPHEAYSHMSMILEEVNAIVGTFHMENLIADDARKYQEALDQQQKESEMKESSDATNALVDDWLLEDRDDEHLYFSPDKGNVVFASAIDGWAFRIDHFARIYASKLGVKEAALKRVLWGDFYLDPKTKRAVGPKGLKGRALKPFFVQFILDNIWAVYDAIENDREKLEKIVKVLNLKILPRELKQKDPKPVLQTVMTQWLPLSATILQATVEVIPSPKNAQKDKIPVLLSTLPPLKSQVADSFTQEEEAMIACDASSPHTVVYVCKMFSAPADVIAASLKSAAGGIAGSTSDRVQLSSEESREQRRLAVISERAARKKLEMDTAAQLAGTNTNAVSGAEGIAIARREEADVKPLPGFLSASGVAPAVVESENEDETLIGFARCYSGTVKVGQVLHVLGPKYHPSKPDLYRTEVTISKLYMMMGRELHPLDEVPAGNVFGIGGLEGKVLKSGTLTSSTTVRSFGGINGDAPILRVAVEPMNPGELEKLRIGLQLLNQADPCVEVIEQKTGELVIVTAGALHLERCLKDLRERFAKIEIEVSEPIVPFRETIFNIPAIATSSNFILLFSVSVDTQDRAPDQDDTPSAEPLPTGTVVSSVSGGIATFRIRALPIPKNVTAFLESSSRRLKALTDSSRATDVEVESDDAKGEKSVFMHDLAVQFQEARKIGNLVEKEKWENLEARILAFGPNDVGPNILFNDYEAGALSSWSSPASSKSRSRQESSVPTEGSDSATCVRIASPREYEGSIIAGFQQAMFEGPLCNEPMMGVAVFIEQFQLNFDGADGSVSRQIGLLPSLVMPAVKEACRQAFLQWSPRLALAMYSCDLQAPSEVLGKVYAVLSKRRGRILSEEVKDGTPFFQIKSLLPVIESFGFSDDIRKRTAGSAIPQLIFSGFEILDIDPFWVPTTQEELEDLGDKADRENAAKKYMEGVRRRKGLFVEKKIVEHAEKQRTLKQK